MPDYFQSNRELWDAWTPIHASSEFYEVDRFKAGHSTLLDLEHREVGDVVGRSLLHLQCHFGLDTLSWARLGAKATGVDFSPKSITQARDLAVAIDIPARFICCNLYDLPQQLTARFDIVFTSGGVLPWLPDLQRWADVIAHFLKPGGLFYIREFHPVGSIFDDREGVTTPAIHYPYFHSDQPMRFEESGSYAERSSPVSTVSFEWAHSLSDVLNALLNADLRIEQFNEFPYCTYQSLPFLEKGTDGLWRYPAGPDSLPLMFSIRATRDAG